MALSQLDCIPIADLNPGISTSKVIHGIVTLVWPYSSVNHTVSFLLVEPDFRLRRQRGQVRISLRGSCARRVTRTGLASGDEIYLSADGAEWQKDDTVASTPGRGIEWELLYREQFRFERVSEDGENTFVDTGRMSSSPELPSSSIVPSTITLPATSFEVRATPRRELQIHEPLNVWSSPIFIKDKRLPDIFPQNSNSSAFQEEEEEEVEEDQWPSGPPSKRLKFGRKSDQWHFVRQSASPDADEIPSTNTDRMGASTVPISISSLPAQDVLQAQASIANVSELPDLHETRPVAEGSGGNIDQVLTPFQSVLEMQKSPISNEASSLKSPEALTGKEPDITTARSPTQDDSIKGMEESQLDSYPILDTFSQLPLETTTSSISFVSEQDANVEKVVEKVVENQEDHLITQSQSLDLPQVLSSRTSFSSVPGRLPSQTPEPQLEINIQSSTPLVQPLSMEAIPFTPRLQPLPSPGLDLVSPIDQRHPTHFGGYFARKNTEPGLNSPSQVSNASYPAITDAHGQDIRTTTTDDLQTLRSDKQSVKKPQVIGDTFFNRLLAQYDKGADQTSEPADDQLLSSPAPVSNSWDDRADDKSTSILSTSAKAILVDQNSNALMQTKHSANQPDVKLDLVEVQDDGSVEQLKIDTEVVEDDDTSESDSETNDTIIGKWRDATYKPSEEVSVESKLHASSPLMTQYPDSVHSSRQSTSRDGPGEVSDSALNMAAVVQDHKAIPDTYFPDDSHKDRSPSLEANDDHGVEVVDLLDSDSSASMSEPPEDRLTTKPVNDESNAATDLNIIAIQAASSPHNEIGNANLEEKPFMNSVQSEDDQNSAEIQQEEFNDLGAEFANTDDDNMKDLSQVVSEDVDKQNIDLPQLHSPATTAQETMRIEDDSQPKSTTVPTESMRSLRQTTRSQSRQPFEAFDLEDDKAIEQPEPFPAARSNQNDETNLAPQGVRTANDYYSTLARLSDFHNGLTSLLAVVVASSKPIRSTTGPRDFTQSAYLAAPNSQPNNDFTIAQFFRPYSSALPYPLPTGSIILLKNFKVQTYKRKISLISTSTSAWAVFDQASATNQSEMKVSIAGPPVDFGGAERGIAWGLGKWWISLDHSSRTKITSAANAAKNQSEAELEKKTSSARKARDTKTTQPQIHLQTPSRRQTRSSQSQDQTSIPNTPTTLPPTPSPTQRRTRSSQHEATPTPTKARHNLRQGTAQSESHELRSGLAYSDNEASEEIDTSSTNKAGQPRQTGSNETQTAKESQKSLGHATSTAENASSQASVKTRAQSRRDAAEQKALWHELRDGAVYKD